MAKPGTFQPGQSGNPSGRPKAMIRVTDPDTGEERDVSLSELARAHTEDCVKALAGVVKDGSNSDKTSAAKVLLEFGWGKPKQELQIGGPDGGPMRTINAQMTAAEAMELYRSECG